MSALIVVNKKGHVIGVMTTKSEQFSYAEMRAEAERTLLAHKRRCPRHLGKHRQKWEGRAAVMAAIVLVLRELEKTERLL